LAARGKALEGGDYVWEPKPEKSWPMPVRKRERGGGASSQASNKRARGASQRSGGQRQDVEDESSDDESPEQEQREVELWNGNRVKHALQKEGLQHMGVALNIHRWRHGTKAIYRRYVGNPAAVKAFDEADASESEDESEVPSRFWDIQTGHGSAVAGAIYGQPISEPIFSVESTRWRLRTTSAEWHAFLQMTSAIAEKPVKGTQAAATRQEAREEERRRWKMMRRVDVKSELQRLLGEKAAFRSVQKPALKAIMQGRSPIVVVMGTGAGKSVLFMLPASVSSRVTVVVVPLIALRFNMQERCEQLGIISAKWDS
jgi:hypothetical protein